MTKSMICFWHLEYVTTNQLHIIFCVFENGQCDGGKNDTPWDVEVYFLFPGKPTC